MGNASYMYGITKVIEEYGIIVTCVYMEELLHNLKQIVQTDPYSKDIESIIEKMIVCGTCSQEVLFKK